MIALAVTGRRLLFIAIYVIVVWTGEQAAFASNQMPVLEAEPKPVFSMVNVFIVHPAIPAKEFLLGYEGLEKSLANQGRSPISESFIWADNRDVFSWLLVLYGARFVDLSLTALRHGSCIECRCLASVFEIQSKLERFSHLHDFWIGFSASESHQPRTLVKSKLLNGFVKGSSGRFSLPCRSVSGVSLILPKIPRDESVSNDCEDADDLKGAFDCKPQFFYYAALGFCLYGYGYISAKCGCRGDWRISLMAFLVGFPMCCYGVFEIINTVAEAHRIIAP